MLISVFISSAFSCTVASNDNTKCCLKKALILHNIIRITILRKSILLTISSSLYIMCKKILIIFKFTFHIY